MNFKEFKLNNKNNSTHLKFLVVLTIILALISIGRYLVYSAKYEDALMKAQMEKEQVVVDHLTKLINLGFIAENEKTYNESITKIISDSGIREFLVTDDRDSVRKEIDFTDLSKMNSVQLNDQASKYNSNDIVRIKSTFVATNSQTLNLICAFSRSDLNSKIQKSNIEIGLVSLLIFVISFFVFFAASYILMNPLKKITTSVLEISAGNLDKRIPSKSNDEFSNIATSVNILAEDLQMAQTQIEKLNKELKFQFRDKIGELNYEINQKRQAESLLKQSEEQFRLLFELAPIGMVISSIQGIILKVNAAFHTVMGYDESEIIGMKIRDLTFQEDKELDIQLHYKLIDGIEQNAYFEKRLVRKDGEIIYVIVEAVAVRDKSGKPSHIIEQVIDISERKRVEKELVFSKEKAEESDRLKSAFLAQMSHEIRTPLNVILTAMNLIQDELADADEDTRTILDSVGSAGKRLQRTIDLILNISAVQSGSYSHEYADFDLNKELTILLDEFKTIANEKEIHISYINKSKNSLVLADRYSVTQIFQNLFDNAIKYTPKGSVKVILEDLANEKIQVVVKDSGIGISKDYIANLFSPFSQEDVGHKREFEGNGLGLALVKNYVEMNNAEIIVESEKDSGSTFTVIFKRKPTGSNEVSEKTSFTKENIKELV